MRGLERFSRLKSVRKSTESAAFKGGGLGVFIDPIKKLAVF